MKNSPKYFAGFIGTLAFRLLSPFFGLWNVSPLMATELAGAKAFGAWSGFFYGLSSIILVDIIMSKIGLWTIVTSLSYGLVGAFGAIYLQNKKATSANFIVASIIGTLFFDLVTGVLMGPILFGGSFTVAAIGQIPFTARHLAGNIVFAGLLAPWFYKKIIVNPNWEFAKIFKLA